MDIDMLMERRFLSWSLVTYAEEWQVRQICLGAEHWAYIYHDKDDNEPHYHVLLRYKSQKKFKTILKELNSDQNTLGEQLKNLYGAFRYLNHDNTEKFKYDESLVKCDDIDWWKSFEKKEDDSDSSLDVINDIINGVPLRVLLSRYGRTIVFQWRAWSEMAKMVSLQDNGVLLSYESFSKDSEDIRERELWLRAYREGKILLDPFSGEVLESSQKTLDK